MCCHKSVPSGRPSYATPDFYENVSLKGSDVWLFRLSPNNTYLVRSWTQETNIFSTQVNDAFVSATAFSLKTQPHFQDMVQLWLCSFWVHASLQWALLFNQTTARLRDSHFLLLLVDPFLNKRYNFLSSTRKGMDFDQN